MQLTPINPHFNACDQKWELMPEQSGGRLCEACERVLVDFTHLNDETVLAQQRDNNYKLCGRYTKSQVDRLHRHLVLEESQNKRPWLVALAMGVSSWLPFSTVAQDVLGMDQPPLLEEIVGELEIPHPLQIDGLVMPEEVMDDSIKIQIPIKQSVPLPGMPGGLTYPLLAAESNFYIIEGTVSEKETGESLFGAIVYNPYLKTGVTTDIDGKFILKVPKDSASLTIQFQYLGFYQQERKVALGQDRTQLHIQMEPALLEMMGIVMYEPSLKRKVVNAINPANWYRRIKHRIMYR